MDIGSTGQLRLFTIGEEETDKKIWFLPMPQLKEEPRATVSLIYSTFIDKELINIVYVIPIFWFC
jgi:hypothetical protein